MSDITRWKGSCVGLLLAGVFQLSTASADGPAPYESHALHDVNDVTESRETSFDLNTAIDLTTVIGDVVDPVRGRQGQMWTYSDSDGRVRVSTDTNATINFNDDLIDGLEIPATFRNWLYWGQTYIKGAANEPARAFILPSTVQLYSYYLDSPTPDNFVDQWPNVSLFFEITVSHVARLEGPTWELLDNITPESVLWMEQSMEGYANLDQWVLIRRVGQVPTRLRRLTENILQIDIPTHVHEFDLSHIPDGDLFRIEYTVIAVVATPADMGGYVYFGDPLEGPGVNGGVVLDMPHQPFEEELPRACNELFDSARYQNNEDGTVTDRYTALMWQRCPVGFDFDDAGTPQDMSDDACNVTATEAARSWRTALQQAETDASAGFDDWRLPNVKELESLTTACSVPAIETRVFPDTPVDNVFWTSTPSHDPRTSDTEIWQVNFASGEIASKRWDRRGYRRLVRDIAATPIEPLPTLTAGRGSVTEGNSGSVQLNIPIALSRPTSSDVTVDYSVSDVYSSATAGVDFEAVSGSAVIPAGATRAEVTVNVIGDTAPEFDETVFLQLSNNSPNVRLRIAASLSEILDDEVVVQFADHPTQVLEGGTGADTEFTVPVLLDRPADTMVTVDYRLEDETGVVGADIAAASGSLIINTGEKAAVITLTTIGDDVMENDETVQLVLSNPTGAKLVAGSGGEMIQAVRIIDDDGVGTYTTFNDTGVLTCATESSAALSCPQPGFANQDGDLGRDADPATNGNADGHAGFSFTKLDRGGFELVNQNGSYFLGPWACVVDEVTGLVWEVKSLNINNPVEDNDLHSDRWTYTWYNSSGVGDGGDAGTENGGSCIDSVNCDTEKYVAAVNAANYCGFSDWRLPTLDELYSIVDFSQPDLRHDTVFFPNLRLGSGSSGRVWSSTPGSESLGSGAAAWVLNEIGVSQSQKQSAGKVRLVRGGSQ